MMLSNVVAISRRLELQQLSRQIASNVFAADNCLEAADIARRICPDLILFDQWIDRDEVLQLSQQTPDANLIPIIAVCDNDRKKQCVARFLDNQHCYYVEGIEDTHTLHRIVQEVQRKLHSNTCLDHQELFFSNDLARTVSLVGKSASMTHTLKMIKLVAPSKCNPILIMGEMGTGKELAAKAIHFQRCPGKEFIAVNCASLSANLLESELFGHEKGAFTSADREKTGLLELAGEGCIFLDEISEMPMDLQAKLLRVIQEKTFRKVGGTSEITCKATIIASSNLDLRREVQANRFRGDLYHRLSVFPIVLTPLRSESRRGDIRLLAEYFLKTQSIVSDINNQIKSFTNLALEALESYDWPGNVRELRNVIERAVLLETTDKIRLSSIIIDPDNPQRFVEQERDDKIKDYSLAKAEQELIARVLRETNWQKTKAAELLGISRATLYAKVKQHNLPAGPNDLSSKRIEDSEAFSNPQTVAS